MSSEIKAALDMKNNPLADANSLNRLKEKIILWDLNSMKPEERLAVVKILK